MNQVQQNNPEESKPIHVTEVVDCELFKRMVDNAHDLIYRYELLPIRRYVYVNPASTEITGYTPEEHYADANLGFNMIHPDDRYLIQEINNERQFFNHPLEFRLICKNGSMIWVEQWNLPFFDSEENLVAFESFSRNITKRKNAEVLLRESEERFRALFNNNQEVMLLLDPENGQIMDANQAAIAFYGWSLDEIVKMNISEINTLSETEIKKEMENALKEKRNHFQFKHRRVDGIIKDAEVFSGPIQVGGKTLLYSIIHDITARRMVDDRLNQRLLENETLKWVSSALRNGQTEEELINILLDEICQNINIQTCAIVLFDKYLGRFRPANKKGWGDEIGFVDFQKCESLFNQIIESRTEVFLSSEENSTQSDCEVLSGLSATCHGVCFPFQSTQSVLGLIIIVAPITHVISDMDLKLLGIIGDVGTNAIQRTRMHVTLNDSYINLQNEMKVRKEVEEMLAKEKELLSISLLSIGEGIISTEIDGTITIFNSAAEIITGFSTEEALGKPLNEIFQMMDENTQQVIADPISYLIQINREKNKSFDYRLPLLWTKTGEKKLISGKITPIMMNKIETGFIIVFDDQTENERVKSHSTLSQKMEAIGQLAAGIAHEINTPIQYIGDNVSFLNRAFLRIKETNDIYLDFIKSHLDRKVKPIEIDDLAREIDNRKINRYFEEFPKAFQETLDGIERVRKIVLAIREFSHPSEKEKRLADLNKAILTTITISRNEWKYFSELSTNLDPNLPLVYCQIDEINQVLLNMIVNASQSIQEKIGQNVNEKGNIVITTRQNNGKVLITIQDTGKGIQSQVINRIFDPFFTTKGIGRGTGQGLSIAHTIIVKKHHGIITVDSVPGVGSTFTIELPLENIEGDTRND
jgi:PAS domain S-box-containing protein